MRPSGNDPGFSTTLTKNFICFDVIFDKFVMIGKFTAWGEVLEVMGGNEAPISFGEGGANLEILQRAAGKFMIFANPSAYATEIPKRNFFVAAHIGSIFAIVLPLEYAERFQHGVRIESNFYEDHKRRVRTCVKQNLLSSSQGHVR
jgi:hypothetical protein